MIRDAADGAHRVNSSLHYYIVDQELAVQNATCPVAIRGRI